MDPLEVRTVVRGGTDGTPGGRGCATLMGFGGTTIGEIYEDLSEAEAAAIASAALEAGVRYWDTAPFYGAGLSERRMGAALWKRERASYTLSTKVGISFEPATVEAVRAQPWPWRGGHLFTAAWDYSYAGVMRQHRESLMRLGIPRVDCLVVHGMDEGFLGGPEGFREACATLAHPDTGGYRALCELKAAGTITAIGVGVNMLTSEAVPDYVEALLGAMPGLDFLLIAGHYTLLQHEAYLRLVAPACARTGMRVVIGGPFNSGILATGPTEDAHFDYKTVSKDDAVVGRVRRIVEACERHGEVPLPAVALQFCAAHPSVATVIPGCSSPAEVRANLAHMRVPIPASLWEELKREGVLHADAPVPVPAPAVPGPAPSAAPAGAGAGGDGAAGATDGAGPAASLTGATGAGASKSMPRPMHLALVSVVVRDYDAAIAFFVDVLGFELVEDSPSTTTDGRSKRWVVVRPPAAAAAGAGAGAAGGAGAGAGAGAGGGAGAGAGGGGAGGADVRAGLLLARADGEEQLAVVGKQAAGRVGFFLRVPDFDDAYARLQAAGVTFVRPPRTEPYGRVAVFEDLEGNRWDLLGMPA